MGDSVPQRKNDEQHPLLMVVGGGGGDVAARSQSPTVVSSMWHVSNGTLPKRAVLERWPDLIKTCWLTSILVGISLLTFYAIGLIAVRYQPIVFVKCNNSRPAADVYYHHILQRGRSVPFAVFSDYLASMATEYPHLRFNVFFLIDDPYLFDIPVSTYTRFHNVPRKSDQYHDHRQMTKFQNKFRNVNITVMSLSKYMANSPFKNKWRAIPLSYLPFYLRIFSVWENGGIGMDLTTFNNIHGGRYRSDRRVNAIMKEHNNGIKPERYAEILNSIDQEEDTEMMTAFYGVINQILNQTIFLFNKTLPFYLSSTDDAEPLPRTHRSKRDLIEFPAENNTDKNVIESSVEVVLTNVTAEVSTNDSKENEKFVYHTLDENTLNNTDSTNTVMLRAQCNTTKPIDDSLVQVVNNSYNDITSNKSGTSRVVLFYDLSIFSDYNGPVLPYLSTDMFERGVGQGPRAYDHDNPRNVRKVESQEIVSIDAEGSFVSASSRLHPFLAHLVCAGCRHMHPKFAVQDALTTLCPGVYKDNTYCDNIYVL